MGFNITVIDQQQILYCLLHTLRMIQVVTRKEYANYHSFATKARITVRNYSWLVLSFKLRTAQTNFFLNEKYELMFL